MENDNAREQFASTVIYPMTGGPMGDPLWWHATRGMTVTNYNVLTIPAFLRAVNYLSGTLAGLPKHVYRRNGDERERVYNKLHDRLNVEINEHTTPFQFWRTLYHHAIVWGNGYAAIFPDGELYNLMPDTVEPFRVEGRQWYRIEGMEQPVPANQILHVPGLGFDGQVGYPVVELMATALKAGKAAEAYGAKLFENGALVGGAVEIPGPLTPEQLTTMKQSIKDGHTGLENAFKWMVLPNGAKAQTFSVPNNHAQWIESREFSVLDVCRALGVPPHKVFDLGRATWANIEHLQIEVIQDTLMPWAIPTEQEINRKLMTRAERTAGFYCKFNLDAIQRGDHNQQTETAIKRLHGGIYTVNQALALFDLPPDPVNGDKRFLPANLKMADAFTPTGDDTPAESQPPASFEGEKTEPVVGQDRPEPVTEPAKIGIDRFGTLLEDAATRVGTKTDNAEATSRKKYAEDRQGFVTWANVFSESQGNYASAAVMPILKTAADMGVELEPDAAAVEIGKRYAAALRRHLYDSTGGMPDLKAITFDFVTKGEDEGTEG